jgi:major membrane immunogen (membrane-anchored lipoprotein)
MVKLRLGVVLLATLLLVSCGKQDPAKTAEQQKAELDKAAKTTRDNPVWGEQVKSMDKAKAVTEKAAQTAEEKLREGY